MSWERKVWHHEVHESLDEHLFYFLVQIRPLKLEDVASALRNMIRERQLGSVRVFPIFGPHDLLVRAWLPSRLALNFRAWLLAAVPGVHHVNIFFVTRTEQRWYTQLQPPAPTFRDSLLKLHEDVILELQQDRNRTLQKQLELAGLIFTRRRIRAQSHIKFFVALTLEDGAGNDQVESEVVEVLRKYLQRQKKDIKFPSVYRGYGFCNILIKAQVHTRSYYLISALLEKIVEPFESRRARTETYLVRGPDHIVGYETIGTSTFIALEGVQTYSRALLPELYEDASIPRDVRIKINRFIQDKVRGSLDLTQRDIKLFHDYAMAFARQDGDGMKQVVARLYGSFEQYLRESHESFIVNAAKCEPREIYEATHIDVKPDKFALSQLVTIYSYVTKRYLNDPKLFSGSDEFTKLRNDVVHNKVDVLKIWDAVLERLLKDTGRLRPIIQVVERITSLDYEGS
jgi:hypothetical protein